MLKPEERINICKHLNNTQENGYIVCTDCGEIISNVIVQGDYNLGSVYKTKQYRQSVSIGNTLDYPHVLGSNIGRKNNLKDGFNKSLPPYNYQQFIRLRKKNRFGTTDIIANTALIIELKNICSELKINRDVKLTALYYFNKVIKNEENIINKMSLLAYCLYYAVRQAEYNAPISIHQIIKIFNSRGHRIRPRMFGRDSIRYTKYFPMITPRNPKHYIVLYANKIAYNDKVIKYIRKKGCSWDSNKLMNKLINMALEILEKLPENHFKGARPQNITVAIMYASGILLSNKYGFRSNIFNQKIISNSVGISDYTIRDLYIKHIKPLFLKQNLQFVNKR